MLGARIAQGLVSHGEDSCGGTRCDFLPQQLLQGIVLHLQEMRTSGACELSSLTCFIFILAGLALVSLLMPEAEGSGLENIFIQFLAKHPKACLNRILSGLVAVLLDGSAIKFCVADAFYLIPNLTLTIQSSCSN